MNWSLLPILISGSLSGFATCCGKLALTTNSYFMRQFLSVCEIVLDSKESCYYADWTVRIFSIIVMFYCKFLVIGYYLRAFETNNTVVVVVMASATNFLTSGFLGQAIFGEFLSSKWYLGSLCILTGMWLVSMSQGQAAKDSLLRKSATNLLVEKP
jgi:hypothetical protein